MLVVPANTTLYETRISTHWINEHGIMYSIANNKERTIENYADVLALYARFTRDGKKLCLLLDISEAGPMDKSVITHVSSEIPKYIKAAALITSVPLKNTSMVTFMKLAFGGLPVQLCNTVEEAEEWLKNYL